MCEKSETDYLKSNSKFVCNLCGKEFDIWDKQENFTIQTDFGFGTKFDGDRLNLHLCCNCMEKIVDSCKISPVIENT